nr:B3 domain-containing protein At5g60130-like isoform X1 [Ipomoea trifida]
MENNVVLRFADYDFVEARCMQMWKEECKCRSCCAKPPSYNRARSVEKLCKWKLIPSCTESARRNLKRKILLRNREKKVWEIELYKIGDAKFFGNELFDFFVVDPFGCEKIGVEGEHARVVEFIRKGSGDESHDIFVLEADICSVVKKDVKKEEDMDMDMDANARGGK